MSGENNGAMAIRRWYVPPAPDRTRQDVITGRIALLAKQHDFEVCMLGSMGIGYDAICRRTGFTRGQVANRLKRAGIALKDYRTGKSIFAQMVVEGIAKKAETQLTQRLRERESYVLHQ